LQGRLVELAGKEAVEVQMPRVFRPPPAQSAANIPLTTNTWTPSTAFTQLVCGAARICQAVEGERHTVLLSEACKLARIVAAGLLDTAVMRATLHKAAVQVGTPPKETEAIINWALDHSYSSLVRINDGR
jgi:hypothetical protein